MSCLLSVVGLLMRVLTSYLHFTGNLKIIKVHINISLLLATELSIILTSSLTAIQNHVINYCEEW